ncbi:MAG: YggS family pyridoxal phosphate-dependent enzyme [Candidatus Marinimicrobia bacterium]|nr:YggS family pyridoxal phosphate-dependent enzyme [Candidatus Neomarinimicrobiota bacterium]MDD9887260.1 YggS family pyridoxal phosphate-dependent enzyme [Candidatus Neomarinimicrobiota bacterium]MDD9930828.1 YggS family pyridoxal phosphate-dependent enzyme [Candidatus Neomarinimicrobiota bacterium]
MSIKNNIEQVLSRINTTKAQCGARQRVQLIAVSKTQPLNKIVDAHNNGITQIGENKIQEAVEKFTKKNEPRGLKKRFIGHLQSNKINKCLQLFDTVDSIDSLRLIKKLNKKAGDIGKTIPALLEINTTDEPLKHGFNPEDIDTILASLSFENISVCGLMTLGPRNKKTTATRTAFKRLRDLKDEINRQSDGAPITELSMGMTGDLEIGIQEGSTMVRIGTGIFGERQAAPHKLKTIN